MVHRRPAAFGAGAHILVVVGVVGVVLRRLLGGLGCSRSSLSAILLDRIPGDILQTLVAVCGKGLGQLEHKESPVVERIAGNPGRVFPAVFVGEGDNRRIPGQFNLGQAVTVVQPAGERKDVPCRVHRLDIPEESHVINCPVIVQGV